MKTPVSASPLSSRLSLRELGVTYQTSRGPLEALGPLTLDVADGEFVAVLGPSGCGKSTLLKILSGLMRPSAGSADLGGAVIDKPRSDVGTVFQQPTLLPWKTVRENVLMPVRVLGAYSAEARQKADELLAMTGLESFADHFPHELSGGMRQRVSIARALIHEPRLLLMDEPFAALDALTRDQMIVELQATWARTRKSVVFITHSIPEAAFLADRIVVLSARPGRIIHIEQVDLARPRGLESMADPRFVAVCDRLRRLFSAQGGDHE
jgi:NitT/TauT family transport system ATP-binding protein